MRMNIVFSFFIQLLILMLSFLLFDNTIDIVLSFALVYMVFVPYIIEFIMKKHIKNLYFYLMNLISMILFAILIVF